ncbi:DUF2141 domain-containing protein [Flavisolibacter ginsenosidimutans]|uniref:DUF2141 domain-containing protein n=1 Tax=Flavisolibacter ginsenosidimutans TaxID=661481 RepID=A0A5B8UHT5_9BACT|nr:DUF2141 domain-containing protein [Flavisolibacter ginsenosidimutans]QEC55992.1 DUF2141 domain-containing protein [Flavisolibacter ginsenosidimutans]
MLMPAKIFLLLLSTFFVLAATAQTKIMVQVTNFENDKGRCIVCLYNNAAAFAGKGSPFATLTVSIANKASTAVFENVPEGTYAVSVIHDANNNQKFDTNFLGIPKEGYGASQNKLPFAAAPKFEENKFMVAGSGVTAVNIKLRYLF